MKQAIVVSVNVSESKGEKKHPVGSAALIAGIGVSGDGHACGGLRQVSLLADESIDKVRAEGLSVSPGDFAENMTCRGLDLTALQVGSRLFAGPADTSANKAILQISQIGKVCHAPCHIGKQVGDCIMPRGGVFAQVVRGGIISPGDVIMPTPSLVGSVLTISDRCSSGERDDESGSALITLFHRLGIELASYEIIPDEEETIARRIEFLADNCSVDAVLTTGGTGLSPRDVTPEATVRVLDRPAPGIAEAIRYVGALATPYACLSRGTAGLRGRTLILNLPGSKKAIAELSDFLVQILPHALESMRGEVKDCGRDVRPERDLLSQGEREAI